MNPFEEGLVSANGFNAVMSRHIAERKSRVVQKKQYPFFYNPIWGLLAMLHRTSRTYYNNRSEHINFFWYMFDQVLIRPDLLDSFSNEELKIVDSDGETSFLTRYGIPNDRIFSDHLPIIFKLRRLTEV